MRLLPILIGLTLFLIPPAALLDHKWIVICGSYARRADAERRLLALRNQGYPDIQVKTSSHYQGLKPNVWILVHSVTTSKSIALASVSSLKSKNVDAYAKTYTAFLDAPETIPDDFSDKATTTGRPMSRKEQSLDAAQVYERAAASIVTIFTDTKQGTGFVVRDNAILTCFHVVQDSKSIEVRFPNGATLSAALIQSDDGTDIALLKPERRLSTKPLLSDRLFVNPYLDICSPGEKIFVIGSPKGLELSISEGIVSAQRWLPWQNRPPGSAIKSFELLQISAPVSGGSSGSPVFNRFGRVVGIVVAKFKDAEGIGFAVDVSMARQFLP